MTRTLIIIDPMGFNLTSLGLQYLILKGTLVQPGDTVYRLPYTNQAGAANIAGGVTALDTKLNATAGDILVFGYSEGAQVVTKWLRDHGTSSPITPTSRLKFLLIGNAERRYGGFAYKHQNLAALCDVDGLPDPLTDGTSTVHYEVTDFARQYDGLADFPDSDDIQQVIDSVGAATSDPLNWVLRAIQDVTNAAIGAHSDAAFNALLGAQMIHPNYFTVTPDDPHNVRFTDPDHALVEYVWSPTYPVPLLVGGMTFPSLDRDKRKAIETAYTRPVVMPAPNYAQISMFTTDFFGTDDDYRRVEETGWFPELYFRATVSLSVSPSLTSSASGAIQEASTGLSVSPSLSATGSGTSVATATLSVSPSLSVTSEPHSVASVSLSVSPSLSADGSERYTASVGLSASVDLSASGSERYARDVSLSAAPGLSVDGSERYAASAELGVSAELSVDGAGTSTGDVTLSVSPSLAPDGSQHGVAVVPLSVTPVLSVDGSEHYAADTTLSASVDISVTGSERYGRDVDLSVSPGLSANGAGTSVASASMSVSPGLSVVGSGTSSGDVSLSVSPGLSAAGVFVPGFTPTLASVTTPGAYSVPWPTGATKCDVVLCGAGGGGGVGASGGNTTSSITTQIGTGGAGGNSNNGSTGGSPGDKTFNGRTYLGGQGGGAATTFGETAGNGTQPGGGGGGKTVAGTTPGGGAGQWSAGVTITTPQTITGTVGAGGAAGSGAPYATLGNGGDGAAHFWFYN